VTSGKLLHRYALLTAICTFLLVVAGGLVTSTQSGLSVPDWPTTYGHFMFAYPLDEMVGGIFYEHSHRMIASVVGLLTVILAIWLWRKEERAWVRRLGTAALAAVIIQGLLGGLTVKFLLPAPISVGHATLAQTFFVLVALLALVTSSWWKEQPAAGSDSARFTGAFRFLCIAIGAIYVQLILGAIMRHTDAGLAVPDFPLAYGSLVPSLSPESVASYNAELLKSDIRIAADGSVTGSQILIHLLHRWWGLVTALMTIGASIKVFRIPDLPRRIRRLAGALCALVVVQIGLGAFTVLSRKAVDITTAHVACGALLLVTTVLVLFHVARAARFQFASAPVGLAPREVTT
jgi:heme a synthase